MTKKNNTDFSLKNQIKFMNNNPIHENLSTSKTFTKCGQFSTIFTHLKKTDASRGKLNDLSVANSSTPLNRAFFIRNLRTPKENALSVLLSMVGRKGQPLAVGCLPQMAVFHPFTFYRQTVESLAVDMKNLSVELSQMLYKFILLGKNRLKIAIRATSIEHARQQIKFMNTNPIHENLSTSKTFTKCGQFSTIFTHLKKTDVSRGKLNNDKANNSTPIRNRAFFVHKLRTPKENALSVLLSMVERKGQPLAVGCFPCLAVFHPFTLYRQTVESLAESLINLDKDTAKMLYKFLLLGKNRLHLTILADSEQQARNRLNLTRAICYARINPNHHRTLGGAYA